MNKKTILKKATGKGGYHGKGGIIGVKPLMPIKPIPDNYSDNTAERSKIGLQTSQVMRPPTAPQSDYQKLQPSGINIDTLRSPQPVMPPSAGYSQTKQPLRKMPSMPGAPKIGVGMGKGQGLINRSATGIAKGIGRKAKLKSKMRSILGEKI